MSKLRELETRMLIRRTPAFLVFSVLIAMNGCSDSSSSAAGQGGASEGAGGISGQGGPASPGGNAGQVSNGGDAGSGQGGTTGEGGAPSNMEVTVSATANLVSVTGCGATPATAPDIPAGTYTIRLDDSTLSKGEVDTSPKMPSVDNYVVVHLPFSATADSDHRFMMLNGIGAEYSFTLDQPGTVEVFFVDSDNLGNHGTATVSISPGDHRITVDAVTNVLGWKALCHAEPARFWGDAGVLDLTLESSTLSSQSGRKDDYAIVRLPSEIPEDDHRYVILNGIGAKYQANLQKSDWVRAWFISAGADTFGQATIRGSRP